MFSYLPRRVTLHRSRLTRILLLSLVAASCRPLFPQERSETLHNALAVMAENLKASGTLETRDHSMKFTEQFESSGCTVTVTYRDVFVDPNGKPGKPSRTSDKYSLADIDPASIHLLDFSDTFPGSTSVHLGTIDLRNAVVRTTDFSTRVNVANPGFILSSEYAPGFVEALRRAVQICGGKSSAS
jgi:hypothetical protein